jgi:hypothetical protein
MSHESRRRHDQIGFIFFACLRIAGIPHWKGGLPADAPPRRARNELMRSALRKPLGRRDWQQAK